MIAAVERTRDSAYVDGRPVGTIPRFELIEILAELQVGVINCNSQIQSAKTKRDSGFRDIDMRWWDKVHCARAGKIAEKTIIEMELARRKTIEQSQKNNGFAEKFYQVASEVLPPEVFQSILDDCE